MTVELSVVVLDLGTSWSAAKIWPPCVSRAGLRRGAVRAPCDEQGIRRARTSPRRVCGRYVAEVRWWRVTVTPTAVLRSLLRGSFARGLASSPPREDIGHDINRQPILGVVSVSTDRSGIPRRPSGRRKSENSGRTQLEVSDVFLATLTHQVVEAQPRPLQAKRRAYTVD